MFVSVLMKSEDRTLYVTLIIAMTSLLISGLTGYSSDSSLVLQRITAVEVQQRNDKERLERVENTLSRLFEFTTGKKP